MFRVQGSIIVRRPVEEVFALLPYAATNNMQRVYSSWGNALQELAKENFSINRMLRVGPIEIGSTFHAQLQGPNMLFINTFTVIELELNKRLTLQQHLYGTVGSSANTTSYELESVAEGTRLIMTREIAGGWFYLLSLRLINAIPGLKGIEAKTHLRTLKGMLEQGKLLQPGYRASGPLPALDESQLPTEAPE